MPYGKLQFEKGNSSGKFLIVYYKLKSAPQSHPLDSSSPSLLLNIGKYKVQSWTFVVIYTLSTGDLSQQLNFKLFFLLMFPRFIPPAWSFPLKSILIQPAASLTSPLRNVICPTELLIFSPSQAPPTVFSKFSFLKPKTFSDFFNTLLFTSHILSFTTLSNQSYSF